MITALIVGAGLLVIGAIGAIVIEWLDHRSSEVVPLERMDWEQEEEL